MHVVSDHLKKTIVSDLLNFFSLRFKTWHNIRSLMGAHRDDSLSSRQQFLCFPRKTCPLTYKTQSCEMQQSLCLFLKMRTVILHFCLVTHLINAGIPFGRVTNLAQKIS
jgi:hypothetical protein